MEKFSLLPLSAKEICNDQIFLKEKMEKEVKEENGKAIKHAKEGSSPNSTHKIGSLFIREHMVRKALLTRQPLYFFLLL